jgi:hypothetical protein
VSEVQTVYACRSRIMSGLAIVLVANTDDRPAAEAELEALGYRRQAVWVRTTKDKDEAEREVFRLKHPAEMFVCTESWWGRGPG